MTKAEDVTVTITEADDTAKYLNNLLSMPTSHITGKDGDAHQYDGQWNITIAHCGSVRSSASSIKLELKDVHFHTRNINHLGHSSMSNLINPRNWHLRLDKHRRRCLMRGE